MSQIEYLILHFSLQSKKIVLENNCTLKVCKVCTCTYCRSFRESDVLNTSCSEHVGIDTTAGDCRNTLTPVPAHTHTALHNILYMYNTCTCIYVHVYAYILGNST